MLENIKITGTMKAVTGSINDGSRSYFITHTVCERKVADAEWAPGRQHRWTAGHRVVSDR